MVAVADAAPVAIPGPVVVAVLACALHTVCN